MNRKSTQKHALCSVLLPNQIREPKLPCSDRPFSSSPNLQKYYPEHAMERKNLGELERDLLQGPGPKLRCSDRSPSISKPPKNDETPQMR